jgi:hypothetical protein
MPNAVYMTWKEDRPSANRATVAASVGVRRTGFDGDCFSWFPSVGGGQILGPERPAVSVSSTSRFGAVLAGSGSSLESF